MYYFSMEPNGEPWPESELDEKFVVASNNQFHTSLDCLNSRLLEATSFIGEENILECCERTNSLDEWWNTSSPGCYSNRSAQNQTKLDRNENVQNSRFCNIAQNSWNKISHCAQLINSEKIKQKIETERVGNRIKTNREESKENTRYGKYGEKSKSTAGKSHGNDFSTNTNTTKGNVKGTRKRRIRLGKATDRMKKSNTTKMERQLPDISKGRRATEVVVFLGPGGVGEKRHQQTGKHTSARGINPLGE